MKKISTLFLSLLICISIKAQEQQSADDLAKKLQNPVANLISVPIQPNFDFGIGPSNGTRMLMNIQPVIPFSISENMNLITRVVLPVISQSDVFGPSGNQSGLGDAVISGFFSPKSPTKGGLIWGVGPAILLPTATNDAFASKKLGVGPTAVFLKQVAGFTIGGLVNHVFSIAGNDATEDVNSTFLQPFIARNFSGGYALALNTEFTRNWESDLSNGTINLVGSKVFTLGSQICQFGLGPRIPYGDGNNSSWGIRTVFVLLFPK